MEGVKVLATGFDKEEKAEIERIVNAMHGEIETKIISNVTFVIAKDVLAAKYKFAVKNIRKPVLKIDWLFQCWHEKRLVPYEPFRLPPFAGLTICATNIPLDERKEIEDACILNGGSYSADLTKKCTHLIANIPQGDKFKVARRWGTVKIINKQWFWQSLAAKVCLDEEIFPVNPVKEKAVPVSQGQGPIPNVSPGDNMNSEIVIPSTVFMVSNTATSDQGLKSDGGISRADSSTRNEEQSVPVNDNENPACDDGMYLSNCRIYFSGFSSLVLRKYVNMVRDGGGTRFMIFNDRVTHVVFGDLTESKQKDIRSKSCLATIQIVWPLWLDECHEQKREVVVAQRHLVSDRIFEKGCYSQDKTSIDNVQLQLPKTQQGIMADNSKIEPGKGCTYHGGVAVDQVCSGCAHEEQKSEQLGGNKDPEMQLEGINLEATKERLVSNGIFKGYKFAICDTFPVERRAEICQWVIGGGGLMDPQWCLKRAREAKIDFLVVSHGFKPTSFYIPRDVRSVSTHWIRFCLEENQLLDLNSHIIYKPLQCQVPFTGFEALRFCVSQYEEKDRLLLRNLCFILRVKFTEKLNKKVTHLLCKVKDGQKYHAALNWGINVATADWLFACVSEDKILPLAGFQPRELSESEKGGVLGMTQVPCVNLGDRGSQWISESDSQTQEVKKGTMGSTQTDEVLIDADVAHLSDRNKYVLSMQSFPSEGETSFHDLWDEQKAQWSNSDIIKRKMVANKNTLLPSSKEGIQHPVSVVNDDDVHHSDVAAAIEGLLAQTIKVKNNVKSDSFGLDQEVSPDHATLKRTREESDYKRLKLQEMSTERTSHSTSTRSSMDLPVFDESQMESQMIAYDEDHSGKQLIIERVRTRSMSTSETRRTDENLAKPASWRNGLGRLFKVAEANK
ncbi:hypothetical protein KP509_20G013000 [Ceratopteris richardii]|uniref:BRCT domain-containing protein n=1 Tax=Ceratopteris richardii TaxID=49495 RepID=A0A8T2SF01_CERRI|nr:hypothetical protein KP509_20G013000 [Ceratopteris richardii]